MIERFEANRKTKNRDLALPLRTLAVSLTLLAGAGTFAATASASSVTVATQSQGSGSYAAGSAIASVLGDKLDIRTGVQPTSGITVLLPEVNAGDVEMGMANVLEATEAYNGEGRQREQRDLRTLGVMYPIVVGLFVRADSDIESFSDLEGKRVTHGFTAMQSSAVLVDAMLANGGLTSDDVEHVAVPHVVRGADEFSAGRADAFFFIASGAGKVSEVEASVGQLRLLPLDTSEEAMARTREVFPYGYNYTQQPGDGVPGVAEPVETIAYDQLLVINANVDDDLAYDITRALAENQPALESANYQFSNFGLDTMYKELQIPYHPGAVRYFEEQGLSAVAD